MHLSKKMGRKAASLILVFAVFCSLSMQTYAVRDFSDRVVDEGYIVDTVPEGAAPVRIGEVVGLRDARSETYVLSDGSYEKVLYTTDQYFLNDNGEYEAIDHTLVEITDSAGQPPADEIQPMEPEESAMAQPEPDAGTAAVQEPAGVPAEEAASASDGGTAAPADEIQPMEPEESAMAQPEPDDGTAAVQEPAGVPAEEAAAASDGGTAAPAESESPAAEEENSAANNAAAGETTGLSSETGAGAEEQAPAAEPVVYSYKNAAGAEDVYFADGETVALRADNEEDYLALMPRNAAEVQALPGDTSAAEALSQFTDLQDSSVTYPGIYTDTDFVYTVGNEGVKEYIILKSTQSPLSFTFDLSAPGLTAAVQEDGSVTLCDSEGEERFRLGRLFALDAEGEYTEDLSYTLGEDENGRYVTVSLAPAFAAGAAYPIIIDPSVMITGEYNTYDTFAESLHPGVNHYMSNHIYVGTNTGFGECRGYIKFDLPSDIASDSVTSAYIEIERANGTSTLKVQAYRAMESWSSSTLTWNNRPSYSESYCSDYAYNYTSTWYQMYVTTIVTRQLSGYYNNYGFVLVEESTSNSTAFYSSDKESPHKPELHIIYTSSSGGGESGGSTYYGCRPYLSVGATINQNCFGYAINVTEWIAPPNGDPILTQINEKTDNEIIAIFIPWFNGQMRVRGVTFERISNYTSSINTDQFRIVARVGFYDRNNNDVYDNGEPWDYHFWYQTSDGRWANKPDSHASSYVVGATGTTDPAQSDRWVCTGNNLTYYYTSDCVYYAIIY